MTKPNFARGKVIGVTASYPGHCPECDQPIKELQEIWRGDVFARWTHVRCPETPMIVCPECFLTTCDCA